MSEAKITVAIPTHNRSQLLKLCMESVLSQDYAEFRVVVLDNASSDDTRDVVEGIGDSRVTYLRHETNIGMLPNFNFALQKNTSPYISIFHDDDVMLPGFIQYSVNILEKNPEVAFSYSLASFIDADGEKIDLRNWPQMPFEDSVHLPDGVIHGLDFLEAQVQMPLPGKTNRPFGLWDKCFTFPSTVVMRASALAEVGLFDSPHSYHTEDFNLWCRMASGFKVAPIRRELVAVRWHAGQESKLHYQGPEGTGELSVNSECIDAVGYLLRSARAKDASYRNWLADCLLGRNALRSRLTQALIPGLYWRPEEIIRMAFHEITNMIPQENTLILVDQNEWGLNQIPGYRTYPFIEKDGQYWGMPSDDDHAIRELERLRRSGAKFLVIGSPAFWWLDYYSGFLDHLREKFRIILKNSRVMIFDIVEGTIN